MMKDEIEDNLKLIEDLRNKIRELDNNKASYRKVVKELNQYNPQINEREKQIEDLLNKKDELNKTYSKQNLKKIIDEKIIENYNKPKDKIIKDFLQKNYI